MRGHNKENSSGKGENMSSRFTGRAEIALNKSVNIAEDFGHTYVGTEHILIAITEDETSCAAVIMKNLAAALLLSMQ